MIRQLTREDLPKKTGTGSLHIPVLYKGKIRFVCDIYYGHPDFCYLENNSGFAVRISDCELIEDFQTYIKVTQTIT